jgi:hypothetical protein
MFESLPLPVKAMGEEIVATLNRHAREIQEEDLVEEEKVSLPKVESMELTQLDLEMWEYSITCQIKALNTLKAFKHMLERGK